MAAAVRAVFEIGMQRTSVQSKSIAREERESIATIDRENPVDRQARHPGFGQVRGASGGRPSRNSRSRNRPMERRDPPIESRRPTEPDAGASAGDRTNGKRVFGPSCQRQRHWAPSALLRQGPRAGESGVDLRVGPICIWPPVYWHRAVQPSKDPAGASSPPPRRDSAATRMARRHTCRTAQTPTAAGIVVNIE